MKIAKKQKTMNACLLFMMVLSNFSCKKENEKEDTTKKQFAQVYHVTKNETQLFGHLADSSSYSVKVNDGKTLFMPNKEYNGYAFGDLVKLNDRKILCVVNRFPVLDDYGYADFAAKSSADNGVKWDEKETLFKMKAKGINVMSANLLRIDAKRVMFVYLNKISKNETDIYMEISSDNGVTFNEPQKINTIFGYQVLNNSRVIRLKSGRIILPMSIGDGSGMYNVFCYYSDDIGKTWKSSGLLSSDISLMEPGIAETSNGDLLMVIRTREGTLYFSKSTDKGSSWTNLYHSDITSPESPATIAKYKDKLVLFWNNTKYIPNQYRNRTPLNMAISEDKGSTWHMVGKIESNDAFQYSYLSALSDNDDIYITYYKMGRQDNRAQLVFSKLNLVKK